MLTTFPHNRGEVAPSWRTSNTNAALLTEPSGAGKCSAAFGYSERRSAVKRSRARSGAFGLAKGGVQRRLALLVRVALAGVQLRLA